MSGSRSGVGVGVVASQSAPRILLLSAFGPHCHRRSNFQPADQLSHRSHLIQDMGGQQNAVISQHSTSMPRTYYSAGGHAQARGAAPDVFLRAFVAHGLGKELDGAARRLCEMAGLGWNLECGVSPQAEAMDGRPPSVGFSRRRGWGSQSWKNRD